MRDLKHQNGSRRNQMNGRETDRQIDISIDRQIEEEEEKREEHNINE